MNLEKSVCIIIINYNNYEITKECLDSLIEVNYKNFEVVVIDNGSSDNSYEKLVDYGLKNTNYKIIALEQLNRGFSAGNNIGIEYAVQNKFEYILFLNNDTIVTKNLIVNLLKPFFIDLKCGATTGRIYFEKEKNLIWYAGGHFNNIIGTVKHTGYLKKNFIENTKIKEINFASGCCIMMSSKCVKQVGKMDETFFMYEEDTDYSLRILKSGNKIFYVPSAILYHKVNASIKKQSGLMGYYMIRNKFYIIDKYVDKRYRGIAKIYNFLLFGKRLVKREIELKYFRYAIKDYKDKIKGKYIER